MVSFGANAVTDRTITLTLEVTASNKHKGNNINTAPCRIISPTHKFVSGCGRAKTWVIKLLVHKNGMACVSAIPLTGVKYPKTPHLPFSPGKFLKIYKYMIELCGPYC